MDWRRLLREPLVHFLLAGGVLLGLSALFGQSFGVGGNSNRIEVTADRIQQLRETWTRQRGAPPTQREIDSLIEEFIREEVLYREAIASGLDQGDTIVRRRLAQKVDFLAQSVASTVEPSTPSCRRSSTTTRSATAFPSRSASPTCTSAAATGARAPRERRAARWRGWPPERSQPPKRRSSATGSCCSTSIRRSRATRSGICSARASPAACSSCLWTNGADPCSPATACTWSTFGSVSPSRLPDLGAVRSQVARDLSEERLRSGGRLVLRGAAPAVRDRRGRGSPGGRRHGRVTA